MKLSQLLKPYKPKKPKKQPDPFFFGGWGGGWSSELPGEGGGISEELEYRKVHTKEDLPARIHISKSFYMEQRAGNYPPTYNVKQLLGDVLGEVVLSPADPDMDGTGAAWIFEPSKKKFPDYNGDAMEVFVGSSQLYNALKLKWWIQNRLIELGVLPPVGVKESIDDEFEERRATNFGFHPSRRQFWFRIADMDLFMKGQTEWLANGRTPDKKPNSSYVDWLINNEIMVQKDPKAWRENLAVVLGWGALRGNRPVTDQMVFMFDPKQAVPSTKKMREFGLQADFTHDGEPRAD